MRGNLTKFVSNQALRDHLLATGDGRRATGDVVIVEASPVDSIWGVGLATDEDALAKPSQWRGRNLLGFALMVVRDLIRAGAGPNV